MNPLTAHLDDVGETYFQHLRHALGFSLALFTAAAACGVHALFPFLCVKTGSDRIRRLHDRMVVNRRRLTAPRESARVDGAPAARSA